MSTTDERIALRDFSGLDVQVAAAYDRCNPGEIAEWIELRNAAEYAATRTYAPSYFEWAATRGRNHARA